MAVLDRMVVNGVEQRFKFTRLVDPVLPESPLPYTGMSMLSPRRRKGGRGTLRRGATSSEMGLHWPNPARVVAVARRKCPDEMRVIGNHEGGNKSKGLLASDEGNGIPKTLDIGRASKPGPTLVGHSCEEGIPAWHTIAPVVGNAAS
jgi:hypothetical protein